MDALISILSGGTLGALFGGVQRVIEKGMDTAFKVKEFAHIEKMHDMQNAQDILMAQQKLLVTDLEQQGAHTLATFEHEIAFKPSQWVDNIRALVRPALTAGVLYMAYLNPYVYLSLASGVIMWWFSSRVKLPRA